MRGVIIENGIELRVEVPGDSFVQGDSVACSLTLKNHSPNPVDLTHLHLNLALGVHKHVKAKDPKGLMPLLGGILTTPEAPNYSPPKTLSAGETLTLRTTFELPQNAAVTEKNQSIYLVFGLQDLTIEGARSSGQLPLTVTPHRYVEEVFRTLEMVFSFVPKALSWRDDFTITKYSPPSKRELTLVEELLLGVKRDGDNLHLRFSFKVRKFETATLGVSVKKGKSEIHVTLTPDEFLFGGGHINQERLDAVIASAIKEVETGI